MMQLSERGKAVEKGGGRKTVTGRRHSFIFLACKIALCWEGCCKSKKQLAPSNLRVKEREIEKMYWLSPFFLILSICCRGVNARGHVSNSVLYNNEHLMVLACESLNSSMSLCKQSSLARSIPPAFASHKLPDGATLDLCWSLTDSDIFSPSGSCKNAGLEDLVLNRKLVGNGAHRKLQTHVIAKKERFTECHLVILERLTSGVFADMFELQGLVARAVYDDGTIYGDSNLERPALHSSKSMVALHMKSKDETQHLLEAQFVLPLHARYPPLSSASHVVVEIKFPVLLFQCFQNGGNVSHLPAASDSSLKRKPWLVVGKKDCSMLDTTELQWHVPAGDPEHAEIVASITAFFSIIGVVTLWIVSMCSYRLNGGEFLAR